MLILLIISFLVLNSYSLDYTLHYPLFIFGSIVSNEVASHAALLISKQYVLAMGFAMLEHLTEILILPEVKEFWFVSNTGLVMVIIGEIIRKLAVVTAGRAFTHVIRTYYEDQHQLITHGLYR
jgi:protein-S-isoprenylcysteine O-methyltransferase Ste14